MRLLGVLGSCFTFKFPRTGNLMTLLYMPFVSRWSSEGMVMDCVESE